MRSQITTALVSVALAALAMSAGCTAYVTPGRGVSMASLANADEDIAERMRREPAAQWPARLALVRVQDRDYRSYTDDAYGYGDFTIVSVRPVEGQAVFAELGQLRDVVAVAPLNRLVVSRSLSDMKDLRLGAASVKADILVVYTVDTTFIVDDVEVGPLQAIALGTLPTRNPRVTATASAALVDVRTGYVYGLAEGTGRADRWASPWTTRDACDEARLQAESDAVAKLTGQIVAMWPALVAEYTPRSIVQPESE